MTPIQEEKKKEVMKHQSRAEEEKKGRRKKTFQRRFRRRPRRKKTEFQTARDAPVSFRRWQRWVAVAPGDLPSPGFGKAGRARSGRAPGIPKIFEGFNRL